MASDETFSDHCEFFCEAFGVTANLSQKRKAARILHELRNPKNLLKVHKALGHCSEQKLMNMITGIGGKRSDFLKKVQTLIADCEICHKHRRINTKSKVGGWTASEPNQMVTMDTTELEFRGSKYVLVVFTDVFSRYVLPSIVKNKTAPEIVLALSNYAFVTGSYPRTLFSDNGGEFLNALALEFLDRHNVLHLTTAAKKPQLNGIVERKNDSFKESFRRVLDENRKLDNEMSESDFLSLLAMETAIILNTLPDENGFSSYYKIFLRNPVSSLAIDPEQLSPAQLTRIEDIPKVLREREILREKVRKSVVSFANTQKLSTILSQKLMPSPGPFSPGEIVFQYEKSKTGERWHGPFVVVGPVGDNLHCVTRQTRFHKFYVRDLRRANGIELPAQPSTSTEVTVDAPRNIPIVVEGDNTDTQLFPSHVSPVSVNTLPQISGREEILIKEENEDELYEPCPDCGVPVSDLEGHRLFCEAVNYTQGFAFQSESVESSSKSVDDLKFELFEKSRIFPEDSSSKLISSDEFDRYFYEIGLAKQAELDSWRVNNVVSVVDEHSLPSDPNVIGARWLLSWKLRSDGSICRPKARLIVQGHQDNAKDCLRVDSPTVSAVSIRLVLQISANEGFHVCSIDLKTAFLQGAAYAADENRLVFARIPDDICDMLNVSYGSYFKFIKSVYGLIDAPRRWFLRLQSALLSIGFVQTSFDKSLYYMRKGTTLLGLACVHVDDILLCGSDSFLNDMVAQLSSQFSFGSLKRNTFVYCGLNVARTDDFISISQRSYVDSLRPIEIPSDSIRTDVLSQSSVDLLRKRVGQLGWIATRTRPDLSFGASTGSCKNVDKQYTVSHLEQANKFIATAHKFSDSVLKFVPHHSPKIVCYADASFANLPDGGSQSAYLVFMVSNSAENTSSFARYCSLLDWRSSKLQRITRSTLASETLSLSNCLDNALFIRDALFEITGNRLQISVYSDNKSICQSVYSDKMQVLEKRLMTEISSIREQLDRRELESVSHCKTAHMLADPLTKLQPSRDSISSLRSALWYNEMTLPTPNSH